MSVLSQFFHSSTTKKEIIQKEEVKIQSVSKKQPDMSGCEDLFSRSNTAIEEKGWFPLIVKVK